MSVNISHEPRTTRYNRPTTWATSHREHLPPKPAKPLFSELHLLCDVKDDHDFDNLQKFSQEAFEAFLEGGSAANLVEAKEFLDLALKCLPGDDEAHQWQLLSRKWAIQRWYYELTGVRHHIAIALSDAVKALKGSPTSLRNRRGAWISVGRVLLLKYRVDGTIKDLENAVKSFQSAETVHELLRKEADFPQNESGYETALDDTLVISDTRAQLRLQIEMAECLDLQAESEGMIERSWEGLLLAEEAYQGTDAHKPLRIEAAACLASRYLTRSAVSGGVWLETAIDLIEEALDLCPKSHPSFPSLVNSHCQMIFVKCTQEAQEGNRGRSITLRQDVDRAVQMAKETIAKASPNSNARIKLLYALISLLHMRYKDTGQPNDLDDALRYAHELHHRTCWSEDHLFFKKTRLQALIELEEICALKCRDSTPDPKIQVLMQFAHKEISRLQTSIDDWKIRSKEPEHLRQNPDNVWIAYDDGDLGITRAMGSETAEAMFGAELPGLRSTEDQDGTPHRLGDLIFDPRFNAAHPFSLMPQPGSVSTIDVDGTRVNDLSLEEELLETESHMADLKNLVPKRGVFTVEYPDGYTFSPRLNYSLFLLQKRCAKSDDVFDHVCAWLKVHAPLNDAENPQSPERMQTLPFLARMYRNRYSARENVEDLNKSIEVWNAIIDSTSGTFDIYQCVALYHLADSLQTRFLVLGDGDDLRRALAAGEEGITMSTPHGRLRDEQWGLLGSLYMIRFDQSTRIADLDRAINLLGECILKRRANDKSRYRTLLDLGKAFALKFSHGYRGTTLDLEFFRVANQIIIAKPSVPPVWPAVINIASFALQKFQISYDRYSLDKAIEILEFANQFCETEAGRHGVQLNLSSALDIRYLISHQIDDRNRALQLVEKLLVASEYDRSYREEALQRYGEVSQVSVPEGSSAGTRLGSFSESCEALENVINMNTTPVLRRIRAARRLAEMYWRTGDTNKAHSCLQKAVGFMLLLSPRWMDDLDRQFVLSLVDGLIEDAATVALSLGKKASEALILLEKGRGVILGSVLDGRNGASSLRAVEPHLYDRFEHLRDRLFRSDWSNLEELVSLKAEDAASSNQQLEQVALEYETVLREIRSIDRFKNFQLPPDAETMKTLAGDGYIVVLFHSEAFGGSFVIIISQAGFHQMKLNLETFTIAWLAALVRRCAEAELHNAAEMRHVMDRVLKCLWDWIVKPVLDHIDTLSGGLIANGEQDTLPRIWWMPCGVLSALPIHAARPTAGLGCMHKTISSYIPTLRAMQFAHDEQHNLVDRGSTRVAIYYMDETPGQRDLELAEDEASDIFGHLEPIVQSVVKTRQPNAASVLQAVDEFDILHFACHGESDPKDPSRSCLVFVKKKQARSPESKYAYVHADRLTVGDIIKNTSHSTRGKAGRLVFLSGCSTADNPVSQLGNECIHLAAAFHLAGFSHAIGTMWDSVDTACALVASEFYQALFPSEDSGQGGGDSSRIVAAAYRQAVLALMEDRKNSIHWAPFVHYGP
ncbi:CHAT domain containing protein [Rhypophila decipiens]